MKSSERCKETFQGDRCKRERGHETSSADNPNVHLGQFSLWNEHGPLLKIQGAQIRKRSRLANRMIRQLRGMNTAMVPSAVKPQLGKQLDALVAHFGGVRKPKEN